MRIDSVGRLRKKDWRRSGEGFWNLWSGAGNVGLNGRMDAARDKRWATLGFGYQRLTRVDGEEREPGEARCLLHL